ncbi:MAG: hypothetical protein RL217_1110 [Pseudomonadota bacterium]|jgi:two-component system sensor histidine kinase CpxA
MSLFWRIFLWFWFALFLAMGAAFSLSNWLEHKFSRPANSHEIQLLVQLIEQERPIVAEGRKLWRKMNSGWNLVSVPADLSSHLPHNLEDFVDVAGNQSQVLFGQENGWLTIGPIEQQGYLYIAVAHDSWFGVFEVQDRLLILAATLIVVTLLCALLVWSLIRPIRQLQLNVRRLAAGDFNLDEIRQIALRKDETGVLAHEIVKMAEAMQNLLNSQEQLLHDVSHELRSPLTRLQIALGIARKKDQAQLLNSEHNRIERAANQVNLLISQILDLARLKQGNHNLLQTERLILQSKLQAWLEEAAVELDQKHLQMQLQLPQDKMYARWDWLLMERAFDNILRNAIRHSPVGSTLTLGAKREGDHIQLWLIDQGSGVPEDALGNIFNPFTQVDHARDHAAGGYGLGLALTQRIIRLHQGKICAQNQNPGLRVELSLPCKL